MNQVQTLSVKEIRAGDNDRTVFQAAAIEELAQNIRQNGLIQPITVRTKDHGYEIVAGERRYRACANILGWDCIPAIVQDMDDEQASAVMLAENIARENLDPIDEAHAYARRMDRFGLTVDEVAEQAGVTTIRVRFRLKLLSLRADVQNLVRSDNLSIGYAQILADANLDANRQMLAVASLRDNPRATTGWFRGIVNGLLEQQAQGEMFDGGLFGGTQVAKVAPHEKALPPTPATGQPPAKGSSVHELLSNQVTFWTEAADLWAELGKPFKKQECEAAAQALQLALLTI